MPCPTDPPKFVFPHVPLRKPRSVFSQETRDSLLLDCVWVHSCIVDRMKGFFLSLSPARLEQSSQAGIRDPSSTLSCEDEMLSQVDDPSFPNEDPWALRRQKSAASFWGLPAKLLFPHFTRRLLFHYSREKFLKELSGLSESSCRGI